MATNGGENDGWRGAPGAPGALGTSEDSFRLLVEAVSDYAIFLLDTEGNVASWNAGAERIEGYSADEIVGKHFSVFHPEEDVRAGKCELELRQAAAGGRVEEEGWRVRKDGTRFWAHVVTTALRDETGRLRGFGKVTRDVTERKLAEERLRESEERARTVVASVKDYAIFMLDAGGHMASWNAGAEAIKGWKADEVLGKHFSIFYPEEDVRSGKCERELEEAERVGRIEDFGWRLRKDGSRFWANVVITAIRDDEGRLRGFSKVTRDMTERRATEERLRASEERFRVLVEGIKDYAIFRLDPQGRVASWNPGAERIKGYRADEILGKHFSVFYPEEDVRAGKCEVELRRAAEEGRFEDEAWRVRKDGSRFWASVVITALRAADGKLLGFAKVTSDLTIRKRAEETRLELAREQDARREAEERARERAGFIERLEETNRKLEEAVRARDDFLTIASHELKTPLYTLTMQVTSGLWLAQRENVPDRVKKRMEGALAEAQRLSKLVSNLLDVSRIATNRLSMEPEDVDLVAVVKELLAHAADEIVASRCEVTLDAPASLPGRWDRLRLDQVVTNLLTNSLKYGEQRPVRIRLERGGERTRIVVRDQGMGIARADHERIFQRFERAVSTRSHSGFGLGLWIVKQILDAMGGTIEVASEPGRGATFTVEIPNAQKETAPSAA